VYRCASDREGLVLGVFTGAHNTDDDLRRYVDDIAKADHEHRDRPYLALLVFVDEGNPAPSVQWRRRIAAQSARLQSRVLFALVSPSPVIRGVVAFINWLRKPAYELKVCREVGEAIPWMAERSGDPTLPGRVNRLLGELGMQPRAA
jgi:hypothetical protein